MANKGTGIYGNWGLYASVAELPNTAGAAVQTSELTVGDIASVATALYICTTATPGAAVWRLSDQAALDGEGIPPRPVVGATIQLPTSTSTLANNSIQNIAPAFGNVDISVDAGTVGDMMTFYIANIAHTTSFILGTAATLNFYGTNVTAAVDDEIVLFWRSATVVNAYIIPKVP